jgi:spore photoproduct lyase
MLKFYAEEAIRELPQAGEIARKYPHLEWIDDYQMFHRKTMALEKRSVIFARKRGPWLKPFHCYYQNHEYEHFSLDVAEGCLFDCVYCYLQSYLNHQALVVFPEEPSLFEEVQRRSRAWISTGLLSDSFLAEERSPLIGEVSRHIAADSVLELRSKSCVVTFLADPAIDRDRVVVSWSLNPEPIVRRYEYGTASLQERLDAAEKAVQWGYRIAFHLDPVFYFEGWETAYHSVLQEIKRYPAASIAFLSLGLFRYMPDLGAVIRKRFPLHEVMTGEFFPDSDGKYHYFRGIRRKMYRHFTQWLEPWRGSVPIFWSMEPDKSLTPGE